LATTDAIAFVGDTIVSLLQTGLSGLVAPADVILSTPDDFKDFAPRQPSVTIFLYHVGINGEMRNGPSGPAFNGSGPPALPLDLRFLITPWTQDTRDAYRMIGAIAQVFNDHAVMGFGELLGDVWGTDDTVELIMESLPVGELFDLWDPSNIPFKLSLTYLARVIGISSAVPAEAAPVAVATFPRLRS
jgi:Pvc16 N-terminal domain